MAPSISTSPRTDNEESSAGGPIGALLIAIPFSLVLWGAVVLILLNLVH